MSDTPLGPAVTAPGATCRLRPSPTALAVRLDGLRARDADALAALTARLPAPPWDVDVASDDPLVGVLTAAGFETYARGALWARSIDGIPPPKAPGLLQVEDYRNAMAPHFVAAERRAMEGLGAFAELGSPSGYEWGEGQGAFVVAHLRGELVGFAHADLPDGILDWCGVVPEARRKGVGRALIEALADRVRDAHGTHLMAFAQADTAAGPFLAAMGFASKGGRTLMIRRAENSHLSGRPSKERPER